jgi:outer membrane lipoprotein-sorting protein
MRTSLMMKNHYLTIGLMIGLLLFPLRLLSSEDQALPESERERVIQKMKEKEETIRTFTATFKQIKKTYLLREPLQSEGLIYFDASGKIRVEVTRPEPISILLSNSTLLLYYPETRRSEQRYIGDIKTLIKRYIGIGQPIETLKHNYNFELAAGKQSNEYHLKMMPKEETIARNVDSIKMGVKEDTWLPESFVITENKGDRTTMQLSFTSINQPLPADIFSLFIPDEDQRDH